MGRPEIDEDLKSALRFVFLALVLSDHDRAGAFIREIDTFTVPDGSLAIQIRGVAAGVIAQCHNDECWVCRSGV